MIRDGIVHVWFRPAPEHLFPDEVLCTRERPYVPTPGVRAVFHVESRLEPRGYVCPACAAAERSAEA